MKQIFMNYGKLSEKQTFKLIFFLKLLNPLNLMQFKIPQGNFKNKFVGYKLRYLNF